MSTLYRVLAAATLLIAAAPALVSLPLDATPRSIATASVTQDDLGCKLECDSDGCFWRCD